MKQTKKISRRIFVSKSASAITGITILPSYLALGKADALGNLPPSKRINLGCIGIGGRGKKVIPQLCSNGAAKPIAFCDVDFKRADKEVMDAFPGVRKFADFRVMFDAGDAKFYESGIISFEGDSIPNKHTEYFAKLGLKYPLNEYRASWKMAGLPLAQRLRDKTPDWGDLKQLIPGMIAQGLMGYAYTCPDMIGGGEYQSFLKLDKIDQEMLVRSAQVHALMPMMQFSVAPWRVLSPENNEICKKMALLHEKFGEEILALARLSSKTGEPIVKPMAWFWPDAGYETIQDQFILGDSLLVAPVVEKDARSRKVVFPAGTWIGDDGSEVVGPATVEIAAPLKRLPYFRLQVSK